MPNESKTPMPTPGSKPTSDLTTEQSAASAPALADSELASSPMVSTPSQNPEKLSFLQKWRSLSPVKRDLTAFVLLPTLAVCVYCGFFASPMYVSETKFAVRSGTEQPLGLDFATQFFKTSSATVQDAEVVEAYIRSPDIFEKLDRKLKVIEHYSSPQWDWISRLTSSPTLWDKQTFWNRVSRPVVNPENGIVTYTVRAYDPGMAQEISKEVLQQSEALVNEMNERARKDTVALAENEVKIAQARIAKAQKAIEAFRNEHSDLDPQATASGLQTIVMELEGERAKLRAEIADAQSFMKGDAPQLRSLKSRLSAVEKQLAAEKARLAGSQEANVLNTWVSEYETLMIENEFAKKQLTTAMTALETARASLLSKTRYVVPIEQPTLPDESRYPRTWVFTLCTFLGLILIYGLVRLIVASVREHAGF
ncbi:hypothetical protein [Duodenibacillus massiliensis]|uniref:hypothetical protein n=1 Tax=Duodenibacillus massiliensis TaxID=1852381 RepID=UPI00307EC88A